VFGGGPIGIAVMLTLRAAGVDDIWVVEPAPVRKRVVEQLGAVAVDPAAGAPSEQLRDATGGQGVDVAFETAGAPTSFTDAVASTAKQGTIVVVASGRHSVVAPLAELVRSELTVRTTYASCGEFHSVLKGLQSGAFPLDGWVSTLALDDLLDGFRRLHQGLDVKVVVDPWATTPTG
jgi:(R,R)-butanediol dehydrogenase/meso-butanediol dehydrogenase/diacetyl reductase